MECRRKARLHQMKTAPPLRPLQKCLRYHHSLPERNHDLKPPHKHGHARPEIPRNRTECAPPWKPRQVQSRQSAPR